MAKTFDGIDERLGGFLAEQPVFFVATAPSGAGGHVNLSPKGMAGTFAVLEPDTVAYLDVTGSGVPLMTYDRERGQLAEWANRKGEEELAAYRAKKNALSIDGLPGLAE